MVLISYMLFHFETRACQMLSKRKKAHSKIEMLSSFDIRRAALIMIGR